VHILNRGLASHPVPLKQIYSPPLEKDHYVNTTVEHYGNVFVHKGGQLENRQFLAKMQYTSGLWPNSGLQSLAETAIE